MQGKFLSFYFLLLSVFFSITFVKGQSLDELLAQSEAAIMDYEKCVEYNKQVQAIYKKEENWAAYMDRYQQMAVSAYLNYKFDEMGKHLADAVTIIEDKEIPETNPLVFYLKQTYAVYYHSISDYENGFKWSEEALTDNQKMLAAGKKISAADSMEIATAINNVGIMYQTVGNYQLGKEKILQALQYIPDSLWQIHDGNIGDYYHNLGHIFMKLKDHENGYYYFNKALDIFGKPLNSNNLEFQVKATNTKNSIADYYNKTKQHNQALTLLQKTIQQPESASKRYNLYHTLGNTYYFQQEYEKSLAAFNKSLALRQKMYSNKHTDLAFVENDLGKVHRAIGNTEAALQHYQAALIQLIPDFNNPEIYANVTTFESIESYPILLKVLRNKGETLQERYLKNGNVEDLKQALIPLNQALTQIEIVRRSYRSEDAKLQLTESSIPIFEVTISVAHQLYELTKEESYLIQAYELTEKSKAVTLLEAFKESDAKAFSGIPTELLEEERRLKREVLFYTQQYKNVAGGDNEAQINELLGKYTSISDEYDNFIEELEIKYPKYYDLKYNRAVITMDAIQEELLTTDDEVIIEYFIGNKNIFAFAFSKEKVTFNKLTKPDDFDKTLTNFRYSISDLGFIADSLEQAYELYASSAYQLYDWLLEPALKALPNAKNITIIPDGYLSYVPFETLISKQAEADDNFRTLPYLIQDYNFGYAYSATLLQQVIERKASQQSQSGYGGFAASYTDDDTEREEYKFAMRSGAQPLPSAVKEVRKIAKIVRGKSWIGKAANEKTFKTYAPSYQTLHLSMHGILDDALPLNSHLLFTNSDTSEDNKLTALEIYNMQFNAELAVLSACNTGVGKVRRGEGVMSLSRAFTYAGCPSMIMSLWSVPDEATSAIMVNFFSNLANGKTTKSAALRTAKLSYLEGKDDFQSHPIFWAGFVPMGDPSPIHLKAGIPMWWYVGGVFLIGLLGMFFFKKRM